MSGTTPTPVNPADSLWNPQTIIALAGIVVGAGAMVGAFLLPNPTAIQGGIIGTVIGMTLGQVYPFYFGSSRGSQAKDAVIAQQAATTTTGANP